ncbi:sensor histidine kinase [Actinomadura livida]|uniref:histidine kinase n=1 Tax=Actinomadura livida TaxID=79909 RepID=A0A7W7IFR8_9ACTN|nr:MULTISPECIES: histidine kinase [Actinomadura]MBB4776267.1 signal transduction histidine kinase [Actinomadura catellatispora]GGU14292.1 histidine kinase [Actinomadura livida]
MRVRGWWSAAWPTRRSRALDVSLALALAVGDGLFLWFAEQDFYLPAPVVSACSVVLGLAAVVRRIHPVGLGLFLVTFGTITGAGAFSALVILYSLAAYTASRRTVITIAILGYITSLAVAGPTASKEPFIAQAIFSVAFIGVPVLLGLYMGARKQLLASLQERAARLEREQHLLAERARGEERTRIAREMHDVVANRISVMVVHAGALKAVAVRDPERAAETAGVIGDMGRQALEELRHVIGVLRQGEESLTLEAPTVAHVRDLVGQSGAAGLSVDLSIRGDERPIPAAVGRTVYRLVQEALTNVHKHAGMAGTRVDLGLLPEAIEVEVANDPPVARPEHRLPSGGNGLVGLRERVTALGGTFEAGPCGGGYAVRARIPLPAS